MATFDEATLSKLTAKIDKKLLEKAAGDNRKSQNASPAQKPNLKRKRQEEKGDQATKKRNSQSRKQEQPKKEQPKKQGQQKKRDFNSNSKKPTSKKPAHSDQSEANVLLNEIKALGGDEKDLELVEDIDSDDEVLGDKSNGKLDKGLQAELAKFASGLGFDTVKPDDDDEEDDEGEQVEEGESDWEEASSDEEQNDKPVTRKEEAAQPAPKGKGKTIFEPRPDWHATELTDLPEPVSDNVAPYIGAMTNLKSYAKSLLEEDTAAYTKTLSASSTHKFMSTIMSSGTISDKTSALTLAIQESPVHNIKAIENLMGLAAKRSRGPALSASAALVDLLGPGTLLPPNRRLRPFSSQTGLIGTLQKHNTKGWSPEKALPGKISKEHLILWAFEDWLKESYFKVIQTLEVWCDDEVEYSRLKALDMVYALLKEKPEQEANLLRLLVNKLGDRERKIASRASYLLLQLLEIHPGMKAVVVNTVEQEIILRPGQHTRAKYYAINTLNQTILSSKEPQIADALLRIYFGLFVALLKSGELGQIEGLSSDSKPEKRKGRRTFDSSKKTKEAAPEPKGDHDAAEKLVSAILTGINRAVPFSDADQSTLEAHLGTLFRITHSSNFNTSIQALMLVQQMSATRHLATQRFYRTLYESLLDPRLATSSKQALYLNLLYRSLKSDVDVRRVKAFVKRMLQILNLHQPSFVCGILYLIMELVVTFPDLKTLLNEPEEHDEVDGDDQIADVSMSADRLAHLPTKSEDTYDGRKRDPEYSNAHRSCLWELLPFLKHFHPSVDLYTSNLMDGQKPAKKPDLASHTLINFLDKFVYKNPKAADTTKGHSIMQPVVAASGQSHVLVSSKSTTKTATPLNSAGFWNKKVEDVAVEDVFFHEYFAQIGKPAKAEKTKKAKSDGSDLGEGDSEAGEDEIWEALKSSRPEVQGDSDSEIDSGFEDEMNLDDSDEDGGEEDGMDVDGESDGSGLDFSDVSSLGFSDEDEEFDGGAPLTKGKADDGKPKSERQKRREMLRSLPTFASADDYAAMLGQEEENM